MESILAIIALLIVLGGVLYATRKKPGKHYHKKPPGRAEADKDNWHWSG